MCTLNIGQWQEISSYLDYVLSLLEEAREGWLQSFGLEKQELAVVCSNYLKNNVH